MHNLFSYIDIDSHAHCLAGYETECRTWEQCAQHPYSLGTKLASLGMRPTINTYYLHAIISFLDCLGMVYHAVYCAVYHAWTVWTGLWCLKCVRFHVVCLWAYETSLIQVTHVQCVWLDRPVPTMEWIPKRQLVCWWSMPQPVVLAILNLNQVPSLLF